MTNETKQRLIKLVNDDKGSAYDNLRRAQIAFASDLSGTWGQSGKTKRQILDDYQREYDEASAALAELQLEVTADAQ